MADRITPEQLRPLLAGDTTFIDVRAPIEFAQGHVPGALNRPLMTDDERHRIGLCYKQQGQKAAVALGHKLVSGDVKSQRVQAWLDAANPPQKTVLYCARGGMRSSISQGWMSEAGLDLPLVQGGYKTLRHTLIEQLQRFSESADLIVVAGRTGSGKTKVIEAVNNALDLEALANHRGSAFGRHTSPQPSQANFENAIAMASLQLDLERPVIVEDESRNIGSVHLAQRLTERIKVTQVVMLEVSLEERLDVILDDYVIGLQAEYLQQFGDDGFERYRDYMESALQRVSRRLGGVLYQQVRSELQHALQHQTLTGSLEAHRVWIESLLLHYYDRMYDHQLQKAPRQVVFRGGRSEVIDFLNQRQNGN
ncbi:tRNA 2-selenouridine(34) synthase MnmH [Saccharospirillum sp. MSK14-1]|uniref:tRNA 2-selenouridine(34) synthase MnmH n=1 Tax=Saccharospirillum sp. MSK14-1 TaxID=1897632 RepID=UPI000D3927CF|nr:tRNA 2-selenouridine(34) synthase MnmH [Saccharospirillum sp. MSK14-1]PTY37531.1 tRNA 2-selenouridine(34) synthase MnmH [Saccharospirillum sp. MSK14-1]